LASLLAVARWELHRTIGRRGFVIATAAVPVVLLVGVIIVTVLGERIGAAAASAGAPDLATKRGVVDLAGVTTGTPPPANLPASASEIEARRAVEAGRLEGYFVIPPEYLVSGRIRYVTSDPGVFGTKLEAAQTAIAAHLVGRLLGARVDVLTAARVRSPVALVAEDLAGEPVVRGAGEVVAFFVPYLIAVLFLVSVFVSSGYLLEGVSEEKESRVIEIVLGAITPDHLLVGKLVGQAAAGLLQVGIWVLGGLALLPLLLRQLGDLGEVALSPAIVPLSVLVFLLGFLLLAGVYASAAAMSTSSREGQQLAAWLAVVVAVPFMFSTAIIYQPDGGLAVAFTFVPFMAPPAVLLRLAAGSQDWLTISVGLAILAASIPVMLWVSTRIFRIGLLVYGKRLSLRAVWAGLRGS